MVVQMTFHQHLWVRWLQPCCLRLVKWNCSTLVNVWSLVLEILDGRMVASGVRKPTLPMKWRNRFYRNEKKVGVFVNSPKNSKFLTKHCVSSCQSLCRVSADCVWFIALCRKSYENQRYYKYMNDKDEKNRNLCSSLSVF